MELKALEFSVTENVLEAVLPPVEFPYIRGEVGEPLDVRRGLGCMRLGGGRLAGGGRALGRGFRWQGRLRPWRRLAGWRRGCPKPGDSGAG